MKIIPGRSFTYTVLDNKDRPVQKNFTTYAAAQHWVSNNIIPVSDYPVEQPTFEVETNDCGLPAVDGVCEHMIIRYNN